MGDPETKVKRSAKRKRNYIAKEMLESRGMKKKIHISDKDRDKQRKWRLKNDPEADYENLDDWLVRDAKT
jgi:hypothetical protein